MKDAAATAPAGAHSLFGLGTVATQRQRVGAVAVCLTLLTATIVASVFGRAAGPEIKPFVPITSTIGSLADLLTAFLLLAQFYVNGCVPNAVFGLDTPSPVTCRSCSSLRFRACFAPAR